MGSAQHGVLNVHFGWSKKKAPSSIRLSFETQRKTPWFGDLWGPLSLANRSGKLPTWGNMASTEFEVGSKIAPECDQHKKCFVRYLFSRSCPNMVKMGSTQNKI